MELRVSANFGSFVARTDSEFAAGAAFAVFRATANGGGFCLINVDEPFEGEGWVIHEKHRDGGRQLPNALLDIAGMGLTVEFDQSAKEEWDVRSK